MKRFRAPLFGFAVGCSAAFGAVSASAQDDVMVVFDGSNSMWGQIDGVAKIEIARDVMKNLLGEWTTDRKVGLMAYGHRKRGDCSDIEILIPPATGTAAEIQKRIDAITPTGKTPLTTAVEMAAKELSYTDRPATVVLISDGLESCQRDPCELARTLEQGGVGFTAHVVGFGLGGDEDASSLACIAEETGGQYFSASNADELGTALSELGSAVAQAPEPEPAAEPEPEPEPELPAIVLTAPDTALVGSLVQVGWDRTLAERDYVTVVTPDAEPGKSGDYVRVGKDMAGKLRMPAQTGLYELRYVRNEGKEIQGRRMIELVDPEISLDGPETALTGEKFKVNWTGAVDARDFITIVAMGAEEGKSGTYIRVNDDSDGTLQAPATTGMYELRYVLNQGKRTMARKPIEITEPEVTVDGPETALTGETFKVSWTGAVDARDFITIVAMGAEEGKSGTYIRVNDDGDGTLQAPATTGLYELRYVLNEGKRTLARKPIEITEPEVTVDGPETALTGETFKVGWTGAVNPNDYVTIVPMGSEEGESGHYTRVRENSEDTLQAPANTGMYELRYVLNEGKRTLARKPIEITEPEVTVDGPDQIRAGDTIKVTWTGTVDANDYITVVPAGSPDDESGEYFRVQTKAAGDLSAPDQTGLYELRYVLNEGRRVLARHPIEVLAADAALESGASLTAPDSAAPGSTIEIGWSVDSSSADQRITLARADQAIFTWITAVKATDNPPVQMPMPQEPGVYELRFLDLTAQAVLARKVITVQ